MSTTREEMAVLVADVVAEHFERLRGDLFLKMLDLRSDVLAKMIELRTPRFVVNPKGELYVSGEFAGDLRLVFESISPRIAQDVLVALKAAQTGDGDGA